jgi:hypothetical protein
LRRAVPYLLLIILLGLIAGLTPRNFAFGWDFRNNLWGPANILINGDSPYSLDPSYGPFINVWFPTGIGAFFTLGYLPFDAAARLWLFLELCGLSFFIWFAGNKKVPSPWLLMVCILLIFFFPPLYVHFILGQYSIFFASLLIIYVLIPDKRIWTPALLAIALVKPQLGILIYPGLIFSEFMKSGPGGAAKLVLITAGWVFFFTVPLFLLAPRWPLDFAIVTLKNFEIGWGQPSLYVQLSAAMGSVGGMIAWGLLFITLCLSLWLWSKFDEQTALVWSLALTPLVTPYIWSWDFVLMLPALLWLVVRAKSTHGRIVILVGAFLIDAIIVSLRWNKDIADSSQIWIPSALMLVFIISMLADREVNSTTATRSSLILKWFRGLVR